jgi:hypothetical protein
MAIPIFDALLDVAGTVLEKVIPDKNKRDALAHELATMGEKNTHALLLGQIELNKVEAQGNWFQKGWRPATGWVCVTALANNFLLMPYLGHQWEGLVPLDTATLLPILLGMLGLGAMRTTEKLKSKQDG